MAKLKPNRFAIFLLILSCVISGINSPVARYGLQSIPVPLFGFIRLTIPLILVTPILLLKKRKRLQPQHIMMALLFGVMIYFAANGLFYLGVKRSGAVNAAIIGLLEPMLMFTFSVEFMREKFSARILTGIAIAFAGSLLVIFGPIITQGSLNFGDSLLGNLLLVSCVMCGVGGLWVAKIALKQMDRIQLLFWSLVAGTTIYAVLSFGQWSQIPSIFHTPSLAYAVLFGAIFNGLFAYLFAFYAISRLKGEEYGLFEYVAPATAAIVAVVFFGEKFTAVLLLGIVIIFTGLYIAEVKHLGPASSHLHRPH